VVRGEPGCGTKVRQLSFQLHGYGKQWGAELYEGPLRLIDKNGKILEEFDGKDYLNHIVERVEDWSYLKFPYYKKMGWPEGCTASLPLGRLNVPTRSTPAGK